VNCRAQKVGRRRAEACATAATRGTEEVKVAGFNIWQGRSMEILCA
jgi:hypothetical protein